MSALSCYINGNFTFLDLVRVQFNIPIPNLDGGVFFPLRAFTKRPLYTATGPAVRSDGTPASICDPFCDSTTVYLTTSYESCILPSGAIDDPQDCDTITAGFAQVPPFTDLTYPPVPSPVPSPPSPVVQNNSYQSYKVETKFTKTFSKF